MKKVLAVLIAIGSIAAIIVVVFFGVLPHSKDPNVYCDYILVNAPSIYEHGEPRCEVLKRPDDSEIKAGDYWYDNDYHYRIHIADHTCLEENKLHLYCQPMSNQVGKLVSNPGLNFICFAPEEPKLVIEKDNGGIIDFQNEHFNDKQLYGYTFRITSVDAHQQYINLRILIKGGNTL